MKKLLFFAFFSAVFCVCSNVWGCTVDNTFDNGNKYQNYSVGQTWVAECSGAVTSVTLNGIADSTLRIYKGEGNGGKLLTSQAINISGVAEITLDDIVKVVSGQVYTIWIGSVTEYYYSYKTYDNGGRYYMGGGPYANFDLYFKVIVEEYPSLTVAPATTSGSVSADSGDIASCSSSGGTCFDYYAAGSMIILTATPDSGYATSWSGCSSSDGNTCTVFSLSQDTTVNVSFIHENTDDNDGVPDSEEDNVPSPGGGKQGDGNGDGTPDRKQANVTSLLTSNGNNEYATLDAKAAVGASLEDVKAVTPASVDAPANLSFPYGLLDFKVAGVQPGATITLSVFVDLDTSINSYMKKNMKTGYWDNIATSVDHTSKAGKTIVTFTIKDGGPYDEDGIANGTIVDAGGVSSSGSSVPDATAAYYTLLVLLLAGAGILMLRRRRQ